MTERISYVINTFNRPNLLFGTIDSVVNQVFSNIDIIVVDDCSDIDLKFKISNQYSGNVSYIRNKKNLGLACSRQIGLSEAKTEYVCFLDDDDLLIDEYKTQKQFDLINKNKNIAVVCTDVLEDDGINEIYSVITWPDDVKSHLLRRNGIIYPSTTMVRKSLLLAVGGFDDKFKRGVDSDVYRRIVLSGFDIIYHNEKCVKYLVDQKDKITNYNTREGVFKDIVSQMLVVRKYWKYFVVHPVSLFFRLKNIIKSLVKLVVR